MDLVEIRKKAKGRKKRTEEVHEPIVEPIPDATEPDLAEDPAAESIEIEPEVEPAAAEEVVTGHEAENAGDAEPVAQDSGAVVEAQAGESMEKDPLDALFAFTVESSLATDENYLQALVDDDETTDYDVQQWLTFSLADEEYALTIDSVSEIIKPREVTDIPRVPDFIRGIISLRGIIVPVFDLNRRLSLGTSEMGSSARIIVCQDGERLAGFLVDRINQVVNVPLASIEPPPTVLSGLDRDFVEGVGRVDQKMLILLHLSNVINAELV